MDTFLSISIGIGLAAACGFRVFIPMLALSVAAYSGHVTLAPAFAWIGTTPALVAFGVATALEILGYYIPWVDNLLDTAATPAAVVAGTVVTAAMVTQMSPFLQWTLAVIAGGGIAGIIQTATVATRAASTATSGGVANPVVATAELGLAGGMSLLSLVVPFLALGAVVGLAGFGSYKVYRRTRPKTIPSVAGGDGAPAMLVAQPQSGGCTAVGEPGGSTLPRS